MPLYPRDTCRDTCAVKSNCTTHVIEACEKRLAGRAEKFSPLRRAEAKDRVKESRNIAKNLSHS